MSDPVTIILTLLGIVITVAGSVAGAAWIVSQAIGSSERRMASLIDGGLCRVYDHMSVQASESRARHQTVLQRIGQVETELHDVRTDVGQLHSRVSVIEQTHVEGDGR